MIVETVAAVGVVEGIERWFLKREEGKAAGRGGGHGTSVQGVSPGY